VDGQTAGLTTGILNALAA